MSLFGSVREAFGNAGARLDRSVEAAGAARLPMGVAKFFPGGLPALLDRLRAAGFGAAVDSWQGSGPPGRVPADDLARLLGPAVTAALARDLGLPESRVAVSLAEFLPAAVRRESPDGRLRPQPQFSTQIADEA